MAWTAPKTWTNEPLVATDMNTHIRDNLLALKEPPTGHYEADEGSNRTTTSTSFVNVDASGPDIDGIFRQTLVTNGGDIQIHFHGNVHGSAAGDMVFLNVSMDGAVLALNDGFIGIICATGTNAPPGNPIGFTRLITGVSAGSHIFRLMWKVDTGTTGTMYTGAGTSNGDFHPQFWVREVS